MKLCSSNPIPMTCAIPIFPILITCQSKTLSQVSETLRLFVTHEYDPSILPLSEMTWFALVIIIIKLVFPCSLKTWDLLLNLTIFLFISGLLPKENIFFSLFYMRIFSFSWNFINLGRISRFLRFVTRFPSTNFALEIYSNRSSILILISRFFFHTKVTE